MVKIYFYFFLPIPYCICDVVRKNNSIFGGYMNNDYEDQSTF